MKTPRFAFRIAPVFATALFASAVLADDVFVPNENENSPGPSNNAFPFNNGGPMRVQQIFHADEFGGLSGVVTQLAFRPDEAFGDPFTSGPIDVEVRLSHTSRDPLSMSETYADNYGSDVTLVLDDTVTMSSADDGSFDIILDVDDVFIYNGVDHLLVEYKVFNAAFTTQFDAAGTGLGEGGLASINRVWGFDPNGATGSSAGDDGYVTMVAVGEGGGNPNIRVGGSCPGTVTIDYSNFAANTTVGVVFASNTGNFVIPNGPCAGTQLGLGSQNLQLVNTFNSGSGSGTRQGQAGIGACGGFLQLVESGSCRTSNVGQIP